MKRCSENVAISKLRRGLEQTVLSKLLGGTNPADTLILDFSIPNDEIIPCGFSHPVCSSL